MTGFLLSFLSLLVAGFYLVCKLVLWYNFPMGMAPALIGLFLFCSVQLFFIGVLGEYVGAIYTQVLKRPHVVELERLNFDAAEERHAEVIPLPRAPVNPRRAALARRTRAVQARVA